MNVYVPSRLLHFGATVDTKMADSRAYIVSARTALHAWAWAKVARETRWPPPDRKLKGIMLATQELTRPIRPACSNCRGPMHLVDVAPATGDEWYSRTHSCGECGVRKTETAINRQAD